MCIRDSLLYIAFVITLFFIPLPSAANENVSGDKTVGGLHFFEVHAPNGGTGLGIKLLLALALVILAVYCYYRWRQFKKRLANLAAGTALTTVASAVPQNTSLIPSPAQPQAFPMAVYTSCPKHSGECFREASAAESASLP